MLKRNVKFLLFIAGLFISFAASASSVNGLFHHSSDPVAGSANGKITIVEFFDYQCSHCVDMAPVINSIIQSNPDVRVVFKDFPIRGPMSEFAARAAIAANKQGKYYEFSHALLGTSLSLNEDTVFDIAKSVGIDVSKLKKDMNSSYVTDEIKNTYGLAQEFKITGTPAFFIGKTDAKNSNSVNFVLGAMSQNDLQDAVNKAKA
jgi:protein-disulfide isomerase